MIDNRWRGIWVEVLPSCSTARALLQTGRSAPPQRALYAVDKILESHEERLGYEMKSSTSEPVPRDRTSSFDRCMTFGRKTCGV